MKIALEITQLVASLATAVGIFFAWWQIRSARHQSITDFEDGLAREYREIVRKLPVQALLGKELDDQVQRDQLSNFYCYIDLSNEQVFLRKHNRVRQDTWEDWVCGIKTNLERPAFQAAWECIKQESGADFSELRQLERGKFKADPADPADWEQHESTVPTNYALHSTPSVPVLPAKKPRAGIIARIKRAYHAFLGG